MIEEIARMLGEREIRVRLELTACAPEERYHLQRLLERILKERRSMEGRDQ